MVAVWVDWVLPFWNVCSASVRVATIGDRIGASTGFWYKRENLEDVLIVALLSFVAWHKRLRLPDWKSDVQDELSVSMLLYARSPLPEAGYVKLTSARATLRVTAIIKNSRVTGAIISKSVVTSARHVDAAGTDWTYPAPSQGGNGAFVNNPSSIRQVQN